MEPAMERTNDIDAVVANGDWMSGILSRVYTSMPYAASAEYANVCVNFGETDLATSDAYCNDTKNSYITLSTSWTSGASPFGSWSTYLSSINYLNIFMGHLGGTDWTGDETKNMVYTERMRGEAYALRALNGYYLLRTYAGKDANGNFLGYPVFTEEFAGDADFNLPRNTIQECVDQILSDINSALEILPLEYKDFDDSEVPAKYKEQGVNGTLYSTAFGPHLVGRINGKIAMAIKSELLLLVTSPAFEGSTTYTTADAAKAAAEVLNTVGGVAGMDPEGYSWYLRADDVENGLCPPEVLWRSNKSNTHNWEENNRPPSLNGKGFVNPSQNLVEAFGMANGYPITETASGYDPTNPYAGRDPRLDVYIVHDGSIIGDGEAAKEIKIGDPNSDDALNKVAESTKTGYYLNKFLRADVISGSDRKWNSHYHYNAWIRFTEIFLNYAEAANEAWGPKGDGGNGYSAYSVIKALRERAGICKGETDPYLDQCAASTEQMRKLIRNERRIELCFENHRFYDLRRWNDVQGLNEKLAGVQISNGTYTVLPNINSFSYKDYMIYSPIPNDEVQKWSNLAQNQGW
jgi:hypothetical protein